MGTISNSHVKNNVNFIEDLKNTTPHYNFEMVSFDIKSLVTNVPINDLQDFLKNIIFLFHHQI